MHTTTRHYSYNTWNLVKLNRANGDDLTGWILRFRYSVVPYLVSHILLYHTWTCAADPLHCVLYSQAIACVTEQGDSRTLCLQLHQVDLIGQHFFRAYYQYQQTNIAVFALFC